MTLVPVRLERMSEWVSTGVSVCAWYEQLPGKKHELGELCFCSVALYLQQKQRFVQ